MADLNPKQARFVDEYLVDLNATQAAIRAGYSNANKQGPRLLVNVGVQSAIQARMKSREGRTEITQDKVLKDIEAIKADAMQRLPDKDGNLVMANHQAALKAAELQGKHLGMFPNKTELTGANGGPVVTRTERDLTDEELAAELAKYGFKP